MMVVGAGGSGSAGLTDIFFEGVVYRDQGGVLLTAVQGAEQGGALQNGAGDLRGLPLRFDNDMRAGGGADMQPEIVGSGKPGRQKVVGGRGLSEIDLIAFRCGVASNFMPLQVRPGSPCFRIVLRYASD